MGRFCSNCGSKLNENQYVCLKCGVKVDTRLKSNKKNAYTFYIFISSIILFFISCFCFMCSINYMSSTVNVEIIDMLSTFLLIPSVISIIASILNICALNKESILCIGNILHIIAGLISCFSMYMVSIYGILLTLYGAINIYYIWWKSNKL